MDNEIAINIFTTLLLPYYKNIEIGRSVCLLEEITVLGENQ